MEQPKSRGINRKGERYSELASKIAKRRVVTTVIQEDRLPFYLEAASTTGFKVEKIADEGEEFLVSNIEMPRKGYVAVSIEKPEGSKEDHAPFWNKLKSLERKKT